MDKLLLDSYKGKIFNGVTYSKLFQEIGSIQNYFVKNNISDVLFIIPNSQILIKLSLGAILSNTLIHYISPNNPHDIETLTDTIDRLYTTSLFYNNNKANLDKLFKNITLIDNLKLGKKGVRRIYTSNKPIICIIKDKQPELITDKEIIHNFNIIKPNLLYKGYLFSYSLYDLDIIPIWLSCIFLSKRISFYKVGKSNKDHYIVRDYDNINCYKKLVIYNKYQRITNGNHNGFSNIVYSKGKYASLLYKDSYFIEGSKIIKVLNTDIKKECTPIERYFLENPIYLSKKFLISNYNNIVKTLLAVPFLSIKYRDGYITNCNYLENINNKSHRFPFQINIDNNNITLYGNIYYHSIFTYWCNKVMDDTVKYMVYKIPNRNNTIVIIILVFIIYLLAKIKPNLVKDTEYMTKIVKYDTITDMDTDAFILKKIQDNLSYIRGFYLLSFNNFLLPKYSDNIKEMLSLDRFYTIIDKCNLTSILDNIFIGIFYIGKCEDIDIKFINTQYRILIIIWEQDDKCYFKFNYKKSDIRFIECF